ncbi:hypothetical protein PFICI_01530 [Pestalotiopsis fici W106-1]|uniref:Acetate kinase n=1 Tax=Pestalotiopsis fici (strain W106-1 / CGMCC3.15140) TaxID=1229662 RepID=W3XQC0_PESFW|nr:uncharacterized protein PFICI_01530 [Pestalotiopsis fici W106-1]ETS87702.1 hypothetical protein PFICI_01530 [Pestalotiopsis fici W106-1]
MAAAAASSSSSSSRSYASSSSSYHTQLPAYARSLAAAPPSNPDYTPNSAVSDLTEYSTPQEQLRPLDLGPPGFNAIITLFEGTSDEKTVYLGPWEVVGTESRRVLWQCSYQLERLEHFLPTSSPLETFPHTLHSRHRQFSDPCALEQHVTFRELHRVRYTNEDGVVIHDQPIHVKYEFTTLDSALTFQGDLRKKDLMDSFDVDVVWTDTQGRTDTFGNVRGIGTVQRLKLWCDRYNQSHSLTVFANHHHTSHNQRRHRGGGSGRGDGVYREFQVDQFEGEVRNRDERHRTLRLEVRGSSRRGSGDSSGGAGGVGRRMSLASAFRSSRRGSTASSSSSTSSLAQSGAGDGMRYLGIQFSRSEDYRRFLDTWLIAHSSDSEYHGIAHPVDVFELPSPQIAASTSYELSSQSLWQAELPLMPSLPPPAEVPEEEDDGPTP